MIYLRYLHFATLLLASTTYSTEIHANGTQVACARLRESYPTLTFFPGEVSYDVENKVSWTAAAWLGPACIFVPTCATELSFAVKTMRASSTLFAMRGGGHMPISNAANIDSSGVLISSTNLNTLRLSGDKSTLSVGPGPRWGDVFQYLNGTNLTVVGGRLAPVGVPGLLLGGGISWYSYKHGLASSNGKIKAYEAVLADGSIVTVTANGTLADLYWALGGGGNSFALITRFDLQTFPVVTPLMAEAKYGSSNSTRDAYLGAVLDFAGHETDTGAAITPVARWGPGSTSPSYEATLFYNGTKAPTTGPFAGFTNDKNGLRAINGSSTLRLFPLANYASLVRPAFKEGGESYGLRQKFRVVSTKASMDALRIVHDTYFRTLAQSGIADRVPHFFTGLAFNAITKQFAEASAGLPQNVPSEPAFWIEESVTWRDAADDTVVEEWLTAANEAIEEQLRGIDGLSSYVYLNDADQKQKVFESYGEKNMGALKHIRAKYDPGNIFTNLMPGGFKIAHAGS